MTQFPEIMDTPTDREAARVCQSLLGRFFYTGTDVVQLNEAWVQVAEGLTGLSAADYAAVLARRDTRRATGDAEVFDRIDDLLGHVTEARG
ncbi:MAG: hypothetical protein EON89_02310 [Brevundimonas sp.]|nr:MAG: hypothetical protein EON89_02310 [Brevundimonas sp.]